jgi:hypothetical protein
MLLWSLVVGTSLICGVGVCARLAIRAPSPSDGKSASRPLNPPHYAGQTTSYQTVGKDVEEDGTIGQDETTRLQIGEHTPNSFTRFFGGSRHTRLGSEKSGLKVSRGALALAVFGALAALGALAVLVPSQDALESSLEVLQCKCLTPGADPEWNGFDFAGGNGFHCQNRTGGEFVEPTDGHTACGREQFCYSGMLTNEPDANGVPYYEPLTTPWEQAHFPVGEWYRGCCPKRALFARPFPEAACTQWQADITNCLNEHKEPMCGKPSYAHKASYASALKAKNAYEPCWNASYALTVCTKKADDKLPNWP